MPKRIRKAQGLSAQQHRSLTTDVYDEDEEEDLRADRLDDVGDAEPGELPEGFDDEEIDSDEEDVDDDILPSRLRKGGKGGAKKSAAKKGKKSRRDEEEEEEEFSEEDDDEQYADLSTMLDDDGPPTETRAAGASMLRAAGLSSTGASQPKRRQRERTESNREETEFGGGGGSSGLASSGNGGGGGELSVDALVNSLDGADGFGQLRRDLASLARAPGIKQRAERAQLSAPLERVDRKRLERQAATQAAHEDTSLWQPEVSRNRDAEQLSFPLDAPQGIKASTIGTLTSSFQVRRRTRTHTLLSHTPFKLARTHSLFSSLCPQLLPAVE